MDKYLKFTLKISLGLLLFLSAIFIALAIITYHPLDSSFNTAFDQQVYNMMGKYGAYIAEPILELLGLTIFNLVLFLLCYAVFVCIDYPVHFINLRLAALIISIMSFAYLLNRINTPFGFDFEYLGGYLGASVTNAIANNIIPVWSMTIILALIFWISFSFALSIPQKANISLVKIIAKFLFNRIVDFLKSIYVFFTNLVNRVLYLIARTIFRKRVKLKDPKIVKKQRTKLKANGDLSITVSESENPLYELPTINLLTEQSQKSNKNQLSVQKLEESSVTLSQVLQDFGIQGRIIDIKPGPVVTLYEFEPAPWNKISSYHRAC